MKDHAYALSDTYIKSMYVGYYFDKYTSYKEGFDNWCGTQECAEFAILVLEKSTDVNDIEHIVMNMIDEIDPMKFDSKDHFDYDDYARGFLAGEKFGLPSEYTVACALRAEKMWDTDYSYYFYQEVLIDVMNGK